MPRSLPALPAAVASVGLALFVPAVAARAQTYALAARLDGRGSPTAPPAVAGSASDPARGQFTRVNAVAVDRTGRLHVAAPSAVLRYTQDGQFAAAIGADGVGGRRLDARGGLGPGGVAVAPDGSVYVSDPERATVYKFDARGAYLYAFGIPGRDMGQLQRPTALSVARDGGVYVLDRGNSRVQKWDADGRWVTAFGGPGAGSGRFNGPTDLTIDGAGDVYVADGGGRVQRFGPDGTFRGRFFGQNLERIAADGAGYVYALGGPVGRVQVFDRKGKVAATFTTPEPAPMNQIGIAVPPQGGEVYVAQNGSGLAVVKRYRRAAPATPAAKAVR